MSDISLNLTSLLIFILVLGLIFSIYMFGQPNGKNLNHKEEFWDITPDQSIIPLKLYPQLNLIEQNRQIILEELEKYMGEKVWILYKKLHEDKIFSKDYTEDQTNQLDKQNEKYFINLSNDPNGKDIKRKSEWFVIPLIYNQSPVKSSSQMFPQTLKILGQISGLLMGGFSCLEPGGYIPPHTDEGTERYRYHLPLIVPDNCGIKINGIDFNCTKPLLFDDTFTHSAWNNSDKCRIVLIVDIFR
jgi:hypothetical protein